MTARPSRTPHSAFTLVETLLALALSSVLLVCVFGLIDSTVTYHVSGNAQVLSSQRLLGLLQDLRSDIRAVQADPHWQNVPEVRPSLDERLESMETRLTSQLQLNDMEKFGEPIRLAGQGSWLLLMRGHANPRWPQDANGQQQIIWSLGGRGSLSIPTHDNNGRLITQTLPDLAQPAIVRSRISVVGGQSSGIQSDAVIGAEDLRFRFLSQGKWLAAWNSTTEKRLPDAIAIELRLIDGAQPRTWIIQLSSLEKREDPR